MERMKEDGEKASPIVTSRSVEATPASTPPSTPLAMLKEGKRCGRSERSFEKSAPTPETAIVREGAEPPVDDENSASASSEQRSAATTAR